MRWAVDRVEIVLFTESLPVCDRTGPYITPLRISDDECVRRHLAYMLNSLIKCDQSSEFFGPTILYAFVDSQVRLIG